MSKPDPTFEELDATHPSEVWRRVVRAEQRLRAARAAVAASAEQRNARIGHVSEATRCPHCGAAVYRQCFETLHERSKAHSRYLDTPHVERRLNWLELQETRRG